MLPAVARVNPLSSDLKSADPAFSLLNGKKIGSIEMPKESLKIAKDDWYDYYNVRYGNRSRDAMGSEAAIVCCSEWCRAAVNGMQTFGAWAQGRALTQRGCSGGVAPLLRSDRRTIYSIPVYSVHCFSGT
ncbi:uncharacterized protein AKAW2_50194S [Aspergillus luchuensis]|uniref:Uncharacterized protein n=1 Tax=Aspergillus kawachii TaxID=1069201 RepID=A0A7R7WBD4_ASPKA|nr:uncharacterized protein AKAW2_50194S [Aspergillus luchuensis]BCR99852.1 hypothetical protein AKAW2_50194S [Aspergillus luchuensis]GAA93032.1 hypothetical protein AKAW_11144 [Aspergillus luchuensis IFO 4308]